MTELLQMTLNILVGELQAKGKPMKRGEINIGTGFRGINENSKNVWSFMVRLQKVPHCAVKQLMSRIEEVVSIVWFIYLGKIIHIS